MTTIRSASVITSLLLLFPLTVVAQDTPKGEAIRHFSFGVVGGVSLTNDFGNEATGFIVPLNGGIVTHPVTLLFNFKRLHYRPDGGVRTALASFRGS